MVNPQTRNPYTLAELTERFGIDQTTMNHLRGKKGHVTGEELLNVIVALMTGKQAAYPYHHLAQILDDFRTCRMAEFGKDELFTEGVNMGLLKMEMGNNENIKK